LEVSNFLALLKVEKLSKFFGGLNALTELELDVFHSEILGIIGPNGAGKTTLFNLITGFLAPTSGRIIFEGEDIAGLRTDQITRRGVTRTFQTSILYMQATCFENVLMGYHMHYRQPKWKAFLHTRAAYEEESVAKRKAIEILEFMGLAQLKDELASNLPHGQQRALGICIALATAPKLLLLDEPATGMNPKETAGLMKQIKKLRDRDITIVLVEHNMRAIMNLCDRIVVLNYGEKIAEGSPQEIRGNTQVIEAYLGKEY
jgi:ABC-type branched-subunit amino acid transport system ATPase component